MRFEFVEYMEDTDALHEMDQYGSIQDLKLSSGHTYRTKQDQHPAVGVLLEYH